MRGAALLIAVAALTSGCHKAAGRNAIVGTWLVHDSQAPFPMHMYVFNRDGTMQQANPDAGDAHGSDSDGKGVWIRQGGQVRGKWVEVMADRTTHRFTGRGEYSFEIRVDGNHLTGGGTMRLYDADGRPASEVPTKFDGERVQL